MAKGFSFVLVTVVMIMMLVFGMLSLSSVAADKRLSQKAAKTQQIYYNLDSSGQRLKAICDGAVAKANEQSKNFMTQKLYLKSLTSDFYPCLRPLTAKIGFVGTDTYDRLERGVFFYELEKQLAAIKWDFTIDYKINQVALKSALHEQNDSGAAIATVSSVVISKTDPQYSLDVTLTCGFVDHTTGFKTAMWQFCVRELEISSNHGVHLWDGN